MSFGTPPTPAGFGGSVCANHATNPATAICERCGDFICGYCLRPSPMGETFCPRCANSTGGSQREPEALAWEHPDQHGGMFVAFFKTVKESIMAPWSGFFAKMDPHGGFAHPLIFFTICTALGLIGSFGSSAAQLIATSGDDPGIAAMLEAFKEVPGMASLGVGGAIGIAILVFLLLMLFIIPMQFVNAGLLHLACVIVGAGSGGYRGTFRLSAYLYSMQLVTGAVGLFVFVFGVWHQYLYLGTSLIAGLVNMGASIYWCVLWVVAIRDTHDVSTGRAIGVFAVLIGVGMLLTCGIMAAVFAAVGAGAAAL